MTDFGSLSVAAKRRFDNLIQNHQLMCVIHTRFAGPEMKNHSCLGCNFDELTDQLSKFLGIMATTPAVFEIEEWYSQLSHQLNCIWERITDVFDIVSVPEPYRQRHFEAFVRMRRWANFFKHPKEFGWLVHHPRYCMEGSADAATLQADKQYKVITDEFLRKYYSADRAKGLAKEFHGFENKVVVILPNLVTVIDGICRCLQDFVGVVTENPVYFEMLNDKTTIEDYYAAQEAITTTTTTTSTTTTQPSPAPAGSL